MDIGTWARPMSPFGVAVLDEALAAVSAAGDGHGSCGLAHADAGIVRLYLTMGAAILRFGARDRAEWEARMIRNFGDGIRPHLALLRAAVLRVAGGQTLNGLLLPAELIREGDFDCFVWTEVEELPAE